jgi:GTP cyclohydrolase IA
MSPQIQRAIEDILHVVDPEFGREGTADTPARVAKAWEFWTRGYREDPAELLRVSFSAEHYDEMVLVRDIPLYSKCEHHLADIFGTACVAYIPSEGRVVGLSKLSRLVDCFARRLQMQERITAQIADAMVKHLAPKGVGVLIRARHMCMESRGICQQGHHTVTTALRGAIKEQPEARAEFLAACA